jgi:hypothetical protein
VTGTGSFTDGVSWEVSGDEELKEGTGIDEDGLLTVAADEPAAPLTVRATSKYDPNKWAEVKVYTDLGAYIDTFTDEGQNADNPIPLPVSMALTDTSWENMLAVIGDKDKFVSLDLSACKSVRMTEPEKEDGAQEGMFATDYTNADLSADENKVVSVVLPEAAKKIGRYAFSYPSFDALKNVDGAGVTSIGKSAFSGCVALTTVNFPLVEEIIEFAFVDCGALTTVNVPEVTSIGNYAFENCDALTTLTLPADPPDIGENIFNATGTPTASLAILVVPSEAAVDAYKDEWNVTAVTEAGTNTGVYGDGHKAITIEAITITDEAPPVAP